MIDRTRPQVVADVTEHSYPVPLPHLARNGSGSADIRALAQASLTCDAWLDSTTHEKVG